MHQKFEHGDWLLQAELKAAHINNVGVHVLSPGMVTTELLMTGVQPVCILYKLLVRPGVLANAPHIVQLSIYKPRCRLVNACLEAIRSLLRCNGIGIPCLFPHSGIAELIICCAWRGHPRQESNNRRAGGGKHAHVRLSLEVYAM